VLQDYFQEGRIMTDQLEQLPVELKQLIMGPAEAARRLYERADYTIVDQYKKREFCSVVWRDLLELIKLGHYDLTPAQIQDALDYYNDRTAFKKYSSITDVEHEAGEAVQKRLTERLMYMKPSAFENARAQLAGVA
jgi:hypothetical protein